MKVRREIIVLVLIIAALSLYIFFQKRGKRHYVLPELKKIEAKDMAKMTISKPGETTALERADGRWLILPDKYPADANLVKEMADAIGSPKLTALASLSKNYPIYELDEDHRIVVEITGTGGTMRKMEIGKTAPSYRHTFVKIDDDYRIYHATGNLKSTFDRSSPALRDMRVLTIDGEIGEITIREGKNAMTFVRRPLHPPSTSTADSEMEKGEREKDGKNGETEWITKEGRPVVDREVQEIIDNVVALRCDGFVEGKKKEDLKNPFFTLHIKGAADHTLSFYEKKDGQYVATSSGSDFPFLIAERKAEKIKKTPGSLVK